MIDHSTRPGVEETLGDEEAVRLVLLVLRGSRSPWTERHRRRSRPGPGDGGRLSG